MNPAPITTPAATPLKLEKRFQSYRGTWAWLVQRISAVCLFLLIPVKIYSGWASKGKVPDLPEFLGSGKKVHLNATLDILLLLFFLLHGLYGLRVILIDVGWLREDKFFWRTLGAALAIFGFAVWFVYIHEY
jgi:succinate dehydrogenase hydrophobic anchor subunit